MPTEVETLLVRGREALGNGEWSTAREAFEDVLSQDEVGEALAGLGDALWWLGDADGAIRYAERAYATFRRRPDPAQAASTAIGLYFLYRNSLGNTAASRGWLGRAARLVEEAALAPLAGWILLIRAHDSDDPVASEQWARQAREGARQFADADLELCALSQLGASLVQLGRVAEGVALLDEAMAGSLAGEGERLQTVVYTSCNMLSACSQVAEVERVRQWIRAADGFTRRYGSPHLYTTCRTYHGSMLFAAGDWAGAESQFEAALRMGRTAERALYGEALAKLAELRLAQGRMEEAARLLVGFESRVTSACVLGALKLARGDSAAASSILLRRLREVDQRRRGQVDTYRAGAAVCLETATLLELLVEVAVERGDLAEADATAGRLEEFGAATNCEVIAARGQRSLGRVRHAAGDHGAAVHHLERALQTFTHLGLPLEAGRTRFLLARTLAHTEHAAAVAETQAALAVFEELGAARDADQAAAFLRSLGSTVARSGPRGTGLLTRREREVLALLGEGLSNRELAERLFLTRKTVEHHVRGVLTKLGLRSRAEAAAYAVRHQGSDSATR